MSLMNEINILSGSVNVNGTIAYASQLNFSFNASVKENILFGKPFDEASKFFNVNTKTNFSCYRNDTKKSLMFVH